MKKYVRKVIDAVTLAVAKTNARRTYSPAENGPVLVNVGSGLTVAPGWINVDSSLIALVVRFPRGLLRFAYLLSAARERLTFEEFHLRLRSGVFIQGDVTVRIPLAANMADVVYTAHMIEHLYRDDAERLLHEMHRVLRPGGILRINVPSLDDVLAKFAQGETEAALDEVFVRNRRDEQGWYSRHRYLYDFPLLERLLKEAGFDSIERCSRGEGRVPDLEVLERRSPTGLYVEAIK
jgi:predicted SAM-dependent methyltransferase